MIKCPECLSTNLGKAGYTWKHNESNVREKVQIYLCKECGRKTMKPLEEDNTQEPSFVSCDF